MASGVVTVARYRYEQRWSRWWSWFGTWLRGWLSGNAPTVAAMGERRLASMVGPKARTHAAEYEAHRAVVEASAWRVGVHEGYWRLVETNPAGGRRMFNVVRVSALRVPGAGWTLTSSTLLRCREKAGQTHSRQLHLKPGQA